MPALSHSTVLLRYSPSLLPPCSNAETKLSSADLENVQNHYFADDITSDDEYLQGGRPISGTTTGWTFPQQPQIQSAPQPAPTVQSQWYADHPRGPQRLQAQPLTPFWSWTAPQQQWTGLNPNATAFAPQNKQEQQSESVQHPLMRRLCRNQGINKAARYKSANKGATPTTAPGAPISRRKKKQLRAEQANALADGGVSIRTPPVEFDDFAGEGPDKINTRHTDKLQHLLERPSPTKQYLMHATSEPVEMSTSRPLLVVLDLNGTLLFRKKRGSNAFVSRPGVQDFLTYLFTNHLVMVWSSAKPANVAQMCKALFTREQHEQLVAVWARDKLGLTPYQYSQRVQVYKQLSWIWTDREFRQFHKRDSRDTVLIDDSAEKAASEPYNLIQIDEFNGVSTKADADLLYQVAMYLDTLRSQRDVSAYIHSQPFKYRDMCSAPFTAVNGGVAP